MFKSTHWYNQYKSSSYLNDRKLDKNDILMLFTDADQLDEQTQAAIANAYIFMQDEIKMALRNALNKIKNEQERSQLAQRVAPYFQQGLQAFRANQIRKNQRQNQPEKRDQQPQDPWQSTGQQWKGV